MENFLDTSYLPYGIIKRIFSIYGRDQFVVNNIVFLMQRYLSLTLYDDFRAFGSYGVTSAKLGIDYHTVSFNDLDNLIPEVPKEITEFISKIQKLTKEDLKLVVIALTNPILLSRSEKNVTYQLLKAIESSQPI